MTRLSSTASRAALALALATPATAATVAWHHDALAQTAKSNAAPAAKPAAQAPAAPAAAATTTPSVEEATKPTEPPKGAPVAQEKVTFAQAIAMAKQRNPNLRSALADVQRADALIKQARAGAFPTLNANGTYTRLDNDRVLPTGGVVQGIDSVNANLTLAVPLFAPSKWGAWRRAEDNAEAARAQSDSSIRDVTVAAARAYIAVILQRRAGEVAQVAIDSGKAHLTFAEQRQKGGVGNLIDVVRGGQEVETAETQLASANLGLSRAQEALGIVLGVDHSVDAAEDPTFAAAPTAVDIDKRDDVRAVRATIKAAERATHDNWREYMPIVTGQFQPFYQNPKTLTLPTTGWQATLAITIPLYDGGLRYGLADERAAVLEQARAKYDLALRQAKTDVRLAAVAIAQAHDILAHARKNADFAKQADKLARIGYEGGATTNLELIDADRRARDADTSVVLAEDQLRQAELEALAAAGRIQ